MNLYQEVALSFKKVGDPSSKPKSEFSAKENISQNVLRKSFLRPGTQLCTKMEIVIRPQNLFEMQGSLPQGRKPRLYNICVFSS